MSVPEGFSTSFASQSPQEQPEPEMTVLGAVPQYPTAVLPPAAQALVRSGEADGLPAALLGGAALAALAAAVGAGPQLEVTGRWHERTILWVPLIAPAGAGKSPAQSLAFAPLRDYDAQLEDDGVPVLLDDLTLEALMRSLHDADGNAALDVDELSTFVRGLGEYKRGGGGDRGRFLKLWSGTRVRYTRAGGGGKPTNQIDLAVHRPTVVICGGLQTRLHELLGGYEDGLRPRWLPHLAPLPEVGTLSADRRHSADWQTFLGRDLLPRRAVDRTWRLDAAGLEAFERYRQAWKAKAREASPSVAAALVKADVHLARITLVFAEAESPGEGGPVGAELVNRAAAIVAYVLDCWQALPEQGSLGLSLRDTRLDEGVERLRAWLEEHAGVATRRDIQRAHVAGARTASDVDALLARYEDTFPGCVTDEIPERGGLHSVVVRAPARRPPLSAVSPLATPREAVGGNQVAERDLGSVTRGDTDCGDTDFGDTAHDRPLLGDVGFGSHLRCAYRDGRITRNEQHEALRVHGWLMRQLEPHDEAATIAAVEALTEGAE